MTVHVNEGLAQQRFLVSQAGSEKGAVAGPEGPVWAWHPRVGSIERQRITHVQYVLSGQGRARLVTCFSDFHSLSLKYVEAGTPLERTLEEVESDQALGFGSATSYLETWSVFPHLFWLAEGSCPQGNEGGSPFFQYSCEYVRTFKGGCTFSINPFLLSSVPPAL